MPDLSPEQHSALLGLLSNISSSLSLTFSEQLNQEVMLEMPDVEELPVQDVLGRTEPVHQVVFSLIQPVPIESVLVINMEVARVLVSLIEGKDGMDPPESLTESQVNALSAAMSGVCRGLAIALTNSLATPFEIDTCIPQTGSISLPPIYALGNSVIQAKYVLTIPGVLDAEVMLLLTPQLAQVLVPEADEADSDAGGLGAPLSESDLNAMLGGLSEGLTVGAKVPAESPGASLPAGAPPMRNFPAGTVEDHYPRGIELILDIPLEVTVELGRVRMLIKDILELASGSIVELDRVAGEPIDLLVNGRLVAKGEVVVIEDNFGLRVTEIVSPADRLAGLGKGR